MQAQGYAPGAAAYAGAATGAVAAAGAGADDQRKPSYVCGSQYCRRAARNLVYSRARRSHACSLV
jgi:hypothetical protein